MKYQKDTKFYIDYKNREERVNIINFAADVLGYKCNLSYGGSCLFIDTKNQTYGEASNDIFMYHSRNTEWLKDADIQMVKEWFE